MEMTRQENYDYGKCETYLKFLTGHFQNFTTLQKIWQLVKLQFCSKERGFQTIYFQGAKLFWYQTTEFM